MLHVWQKSCLCAEDEFYKEHIGGYYHDNIGENRSTIGDKRCSTYQRSQIIAHIRFQLQQDRQKEYFLKEIFYMKYKIRLY